jgi:hypothetical protein
MAERPTACEAWQPDLAGWLVAQLAPDREALLTDHLASCADCRAEAESLLTVSAVTLGTAQSVEVGDAHVAPADLGDRISSAVATERRARRRSRLVTAAAAGAAAAAVVVAAVLLGSGSDAARRLEGQPVAFTEVAAGVEATAVVAEHGDGSVIELTASGLDPAVTYAMWLSPPGGGWADRIAAGTFKPDEHGEVDVRLPCALPAADYGRAWATTPEGDIALDTE